jgi:transposase
VSSGQAGPQEGSRYSVEFKLTAVKLSHMPGVEVQTVAHALDIHPFMLSRWRKEVREGVLKGRARRVDLPSRPARELKQLQTLKREYAMLREEHELLKKAIRFCSERRMRSSRSSTTTASPSTPSGYARSTA